MEGSGDQRGEDEEVRGPREANLASYNDGEVASYSDVSSSLDDEFTEEAEEEGEIVEVARAERTEAAGGGEAEALASLTPWP